MTLHRPRGSSGSETFLVDLEPKNADWQWTGLRVLTVDPGRPTTVRTAGSETFILPLAGSITVEIGDRLGARLAAYDLGGRRSVFTAVTDFAYAGRDSIITLTSRHGAEVALPAARCASSRPPAYGPASGVPVEVRGGGIATRQVNNFGVPGVWEHADRLICCEVLTPAGNWSSYPPHKHDATEPCNVANEEIYYYRIAGRDQLTPSREGFGYHRTYTGPEHATAGLGPIDELIEVRDHDVVLVPHGYHGPCVAAPGYPMYYLNVMAGPSAGRALASCDDPAHAWQRDETTALPQDPRCPMSAAPQPDDAEQR